MYLKNHLLNYTLKSYDRIASNKKKDITEIDFSEPIGRSQTSDGKEELDLSIEANKFRIQ